MLSNVLGRLVLVIFLAAQLAQNGPLWGTASGGGNLARAAFWENLPGVSAEADHITVEGSPGTVASPLVDRYGPHIPAGADFGIEATLQASNPDLAVLAIVDGVPEDQWGPSQRRVEVGLEQGQVVLGVFDGSSNDPTQWQSFGTDQPLGPTSIGLYRQADELVLMVSGAEVGRMTQAQLFQSGTALLGSRVANGNQLVLDSLDVMTPQSSNLQVTRCTPSRLLAGGTGLFWIWPDSGYVRAIDPSATADDYLVAISPDQRWVAYYEGPSNYNPGTDRFVVDGWVMNLQTDERTRLVQGGTPIGWISDSSAVVLGEHPDQMALVPSGQVVPAQGQLEYALSMRSATSPDQKLRARVEATPQGAAGISIVDAQSGDETGHIATGRGAVQLAWSPDSRRLAYTSGNDSPEGLIWRLRIANIDDWRGAVPTNADNLALHSVLWAPPLPGC